MQAMPQAQVSLSSFQLNKELHCQLHIQLSSLFWLIKQKKD